MAVLLDKPQVKAYATVQPCDIRQTIIEALRQQEAIKRKLQSVLDALKT